MGSLKRCLFRALLALLALVELICVVEGNVVFQVRHKYGGRRGGLEKLKFHDLQRHRRMLGAIDFQLGGDGEPQGTGIYYTTMAIGTPPVEFHLQVDTGSDVLWVNCRECAECPKKSDLGIPLRRYDLATSPTGKDVGCDEDFCNAAFDGNSQNCKVGGLCEYKLTYGDGSTTEGFFVRDTFRLDQLTGDHQTTAVNGSLTFGCSTVQGGDESSGFDVDGILGLGKSNTSILSQLAASGKSKKVFSHCLDDREGGGIFAIGELVQPRIANRTSMIKGSRHYAIALKAVDVGGRFLDLPTELFDMETSAGRCIIDSGTTLAFLPSELYNQVVTRITGQEGINPYLLQNQYQCFRYDKNVDDGLPVVRFHFEGSISMSVYPRDYLFENAPNEYCIGWQSGAEPDGQEMFILGDLVLSNKLILYDAESETIGWTEYNCSSSIKIRDQTTGNVYAVGAHHLSSAPFSVSKINVVSSLLVFMAVLNLVA